MDKAKIKNVCMETMEKVKMRYKNLKKLGLNHYEAIKFASNYD